MVHVAANNNNNETWIATRARLSAVARPNPHTCSSDVPAEPGHRARRKAASWFRDPRRGVLPLFFILLQIVRRGGLNQAKMNKVNTKSDKSTAILLVWI